MCGSDWTDFRVIWYWGVHINLSRNSQIWLKSGKNLWNSAWRPKWALLLLASYIRHKSIYVQHSLGVYCWQWFCSTIHRTHCCVSAGTMITRMRHMLHVPRLPCSLLPTLLTPKVLRPFKKVHTRCLWSIGPTDCPAIRCDLTPRATGRKWGVYTGTEVMGAGQWSSKRSPWHARAIDNVDYLNLLKHVTLNARKFLIHTVS